MNLNFQRAYLATVSADALLSYVAAQFSFSFSELLVMSSVKFSSISQSLSTKPENILGVS